MCVTIDKNKSVAQNAIDIFEKHWKDHAFSAMKIDNCLQYYGIDIINNVIEYSSVIAQYSPVPNHINEFIQIHNGVIIPNYGKILHCLNGPAIIKMKNSNDLKSNIINEAYFIDGKELSKVDWFIERAKLL